MGNEAVFINASTGASNPFNQSLNTSDSPTFNDLTTTDDVFVGDVIELGHGSDTTLSRGAAGVLSVEGKAITGNIPSALTSTITLGTPSGTTQTVTIQLKNAASSNIATSIEFPLWMVTAATGLGVGVNLPDTPGTVATTGNKIGESADDQVLADEIRLFVISSAAGVFAFTVDNVGGAGTYTQRVAISLPDGVKVSAALAVPNA